uniref:(California timema) hypothetical protein n=1 Tax=Timema californicum TaxID=61474 RepID=A0A7R9P8A3_TIMCA|nr:unnamed protein product [Timema californicum]
MRATLHTLTSRPHSHLSRSACLGSSRRECGGREGHLESHLTSFDSGTKDRHTPETSSKGPNTMSILKKAVSLLATFIPLGLFLASISPSILHINSTQSNLPHRQRSLDGVTKMDDLDDPLLAILNKYGGAKSLEDPDCENRIFCEMTRLGKQPQANLVQRAFWYLANE